MKTSTLKAALVILSLVATSAAQAQQVSDIDYDIVQGKIQAAMAQQAFAHNPLEVAVKMKMELVSIKRQIRELQEEVGKSTQDSNGVIKALADKSLQVELLQEEFLAAHKEIPKEHGHGLALRMSQASDTLNKARRVLKAAQEDVKKAYELSEE